MASTFGMERTGMRLTPLPEENKGEWIWHANCLEKLDNYVYFRKEFTLAETPSLAELWVSANSSFHCYVNGRHVTRGPCPASADGNYTTYQDISYCLQVGKNVIALLAHNAAVARYAYIRKPAALWCQLNCEGQPVTWSDDTWLTLPAECFLPNQPRVSRADAFVETVDIRKFLHGWNEPDYDDLDWDSAVSAAPGVLAPKLLPSPDSEYISEGYYYYNLIVIGEAQCVYGTTHVAFNRAIPKANGLYVAETWLHCKEQLGVVAFGLFSDDPYYLYINDVLVKRQGGRPNSNWTIPTWDPPRLYQQDSLVDVSGSVELHKGANRVLLVQHVGPDSCGTTLVFPETDAPAMRFLRGKDAFSLPGWNLFGSLRTPFANICESLQTDGLPQFSYYGTHPIDISAHLHAYAFTLLEETSEPIDFIELRAGQYAILELEKYVRGCPEFTIQGSAGDQIDIIYGDYLTGNVVLPYEDGIRRLFTLILDGNPTHWTTMNARGMRYVMFFARTAASNVVIQEISIRRQSMQVREATSFACSDELINQIWEASVNTLEATFDRMFLTSGGGQEGMMLGDAMLQSIASFYLFGNYDYSEKALREFARAQYETGEIPAMAPSEFSVRLLDFSLLWPVWLQRHIMHSGNQALLKDMIPTLERLLVFFESLATDESMLIGNLEAPFHNASLIDYDQSVDNRGVSTCLNSLYCMCLLKAEWLFLEAGLDETAEVCNSRATEIARGLRELTWDAEQKLFADCWVDGVRSSNCSLQANVLALYSGVVRHDDVDRVFDKMFVEYAPFHQMALDQLNDNPYFKYFIVDMGFSLDKRDWATDYMRYYWGKMLESGATTWWRTFSPDMEYGPENAGSLCHGYGVSPVMFILGEVLGLRPATPGYKQVYFNPQLTAVEWARAQIHTPNGVIHIGWGHKENGELEITIDASYGLELVPLLDRDVIGRATIKVSNQVTILQPE